MSTLKPLPGLCKEEASQSQTEMTEAGPELSSWESGMNRSHHGAKHSSPVEEPK